MSDHSMRHLLEAIPDGTKHLIDLASFVTLLGSLVSVLPAIASLLTIIWTAIRIYETPTVQALVARKAKKEPTE